MYFNTKFNIRLLLCVAACTMCWSIAFADSTDTNTAVKVNSSSYQDWADRTDISAKFQTNHKPQYSIETLQPIGHYDNNSKSVVFVQGKVSSHGGVSQIADGYANHATRGAGGIIYEILRNAVFDKNRGIGGPSGPTIGPPRMHIPIR